MNMTAAKSGAETKISGYALESWFLKTLINLSYGCEENIGIGMSDRVAGRPPPYLVEVALGRLRFSHWMGLYVLSTRETYQALQGEILFAPFTKNADIGGALFEVAGINFFLSLLPGHCPTTIGEIASSTWPRHIASAPLVHRPTFVEVRQWQNEQSRIALDWAHAA
ncbi:hypothetical protein JHB91_09695 [Luteimonas sp. MC1828]|nr:hypothetical protein [Luteimonas sp. MC1828]